MTLPDRCLITQRVLSALTDGRAVPAAEADAARGHAEVCEACARAREAFARLRVELGMMPGHRARSGFTDRVLAARESERTGAEVVPFARALTAAAALLLAVCVGWWATLGGPRPVEATDATLTTPHWVDLFREDAFGEDDVRAGLRAMLRDDGPQRARARRAAREEDGVVEDGR